MSQSGTIPKKLPVRPETRRKFNAIVKATRMTLTESVDAAADHFIASKGIPVPAGLRTSAAATA